MTFRTICCCAILSAIVFTPLSAEPVEVPRYPRPVRKMIEFGFDIPTPAYLREHHEQMQRTTVFDGVIISLEGTDDEGKTVRTHSIMDARPWKAEWFDRAVADLKACKFTTFTDNFIRLNFNPARLDWDDVAGWKIFCDKSALVAKISKETGMKGIEINYETYGKKVFKYDPECGRTFDEIQVLARKRGREWMSALVAEFPDMIYFSLFFVEGNLGNALRDDVEEGLKRSNYGLLPAFFNGVLDVTPPTVRIVDGCESGYYLNGREAFKSRALCVISKSGPGMRLIAPENREKYARQVEVGFGFYLDMYTNPEGHRYYRGPVEGGTRLDRLRENLEGAWGATDEYVWLYGEKNFWWPTSDKRVNVSWEEALPGISRTIHFIKDPKAFEAEVLRKLREDAEKPTNLFANPDFSEAVAGKTWIDGERRTAQVPAGWTVWQAQVSRGAFTWDAESGGRGMAAHTNWGCYLQTIPVRPNEFYYISLDARQEGQGESSLNVDWISEDKKVVSAPGKPKIFYSATPALDDGRPLAEGWKRGNAIFQIPPKVAFIRVTFGAKGQESAADVIRFDNAILYRIGDESPENTAPANQTVP